MRCEQIRAELSAFMDGELALDRSEGVAEHLSACGSCLEDFQSLRRVVSLAGQVPEADPPFYLRDRILAAIEVPAPGAAQRLLGLAQRVAQSRPMVWAICGSAAAALAVAMASPMPTRSYTSERASGPVAAGLSTPAAGHDTAAREPGSQLAHARDAASAAGSGPTATAPPKLAVASPAPPAAMLPGAPPLAVAATPTDALPAPVDDQRTTEPAPPMERGEGLATFPGMGTMAGMGRDGAAGDATAMMIEGKKPGGMMAAGGQPGNDDGLEELRQFLQDTTRSGGPEEPGKDPKKKPL